MPSYQSVLDQYLDDYRGILPLISHIGHSLIILKKIEVNVYI